MLQTTKTTVRGPDHRDVEVRRRIRAQRLSKGLSQTDLGRRLGVSFQQVQKYEKGFNRVGAGRLQAIAEILEVPITFFYAVDASEPISAGPAETDSPFGCLSTAGAIQLVRAYARIEDSNARRALVEVAEQMANYLPTARAEADRKGTETFAPTPRA